MRVFMVRLLIPLEERSSLFDGSETIGAAYPPM
jgi:hypothetical protein